MGWKKSILNPSLFKLARNSIIMEESSSPQLFHTSILYMCHKKGNKVSPGRVWADLPQ